MQIKTERFGTLKVVPEDVIRFPEGVLGFEEYHEYIVIEEKDTTFRFLQSIEEAQLTFVLIMPELVLPSYQVILEKPDIASLKLDKAEDAQVYGIVTVPDNVAEMTVNLQAPVIINKRAKLGKQIVLMDGKYHTRHNILAEMQKSAYENQKQSQAGKKGTSDEQLRESV